ncbi:MAG: hypothetical protein JSW66_15975 [Phycisphaerales bacterium]|nr:MAG: hypothetical protein JSW66_15975 [Phycisphaerales bacterium]
MRVAVLASLSALVACVIPEESCGAEVFLPGMQPKESGIEFVKVQQCMMCHSRTRNGQADPFLSWQSGMMSQAARDPVFRAALTIANQDIEGVGEFCLRCHAPRAWLEDRSKPVDGSALNREDLHGVSCDVCHRFVDPLSDEARKLIEHVPPAYGNAMMVADPANTVRGPYDDSEGAMPHNTKESEYHASSSLCATCHLVSNPLQVQDVNTAPPHTFGHIERTYSEWFLSDFAQRGAEGTCQSCHYPAVEGGGQPSRFGGPKRDYFVMHGPVGGSVWAQDVTWLLWDGKDMDRKAVELGKQRALEMLKTAASLSIQSSVPGKAVLRITNLTGHKLPTGYPEGRRMWINVKFFDASGELLREIGRYGPMQDTIFDQSVAAPTLLDPEQTRVYECLPGLSEAQAKKYGKKPGKSFHFVLNDTIAKDNRIPPKGFKNSTFKEHLSQPVGAEYADGQHWDDVPLEPPAGCERIVVNLMYQSASWEYIKFLAEQNRTDDWGKRLYDAWNRTGQCPPTVIAELTAAMSF